MTQTNETPRIVKLNLRDVHLFVGPLVILPCIPLSGNNDSMLCMDIAER